MIKIICVGKLKEKYLTEACLEYKKRLQKYDTVQIIELKDSTVEKEKEEILKYIGSRDYLVTLEIEGEKPTSLEFSKKIDKIFLISSTITFIIGGSLGLDKEIKKLSNYALSFSNLTFPHTLFRVVLLEQIYRSFKINNNETYHK